MLENLYFCDAPELVPVQSIFIILWWYQRYSFVKLGRVN
jgi:hypothetical protein